MSAHTPTILVTDDDAAIRTVVTQALTRAGYQVEALGRAQELRRRVEAGAGELVITDVVLPDDNIFDLLPILRKMRPELPIIVMSAQNTFMTAIKASEGGAYDYLAKPFDLDELVALVGRALSQSGRIAGNSAENNEQIPLVGRSPAMQEIYRLLARLMQTDLTVLITGESGTGKELVARALHDFGKRKKKPFVAINMAAIPRELIESELFGHEKGAFTGALQKSTGRFEQAEGGTLFLDEIGDMPMEAQTRLLRVLQQGEYTSVGGRTPIRANVRIVAATNKDLSKLIETGQFREDLYYRLNVVPIRLPALRERRDDVPDLARHFLKLAVNQGLPHKQLEQEAFERLKEHSWPGNVRELENLMQRLAALYPDERIGLGVVELELGNARKAMNSETGATSETPSSQETLPVQGGVTIPKASLGQGGLESFTEAYLEEYFTRFPKGQLPSGVYHKILREVERPLISAALELAGNNQLKAADLLGINRNTLRKKIKELNIKMVVAAR